MMANAHSTAANATHIVAHIPASSQVFSTTELLEEILLNLSFLDLFVIQRTSQSIRDTIYGSTKLKQRMFLESPPAEKLKGKILVNPLVERHNFTLFRTVTRRKQPDLQQRSWHFEPYSPHEPQPETQANKIYFSSPEALQTEINNIEVFVRRRKSEGSRRPLDTPLPIVLHDNYSSSRRMHITLPPTVMFSTDLLWERKWSLIRCGRAASFHFQPTVYHRVHLNTPRLGDVIDVLDEDYKRSPPETQ